jgi:hypothetical protein
VYFHHSSLICIDHSITLINFCQIALMFIECCVLSSNRVKHNRIPSLCFEFLRGSSNPAYHQCVFQSSSMSMNIQRLKGQDKSFIGCMYCKSLSPVVISIRCHRTSETKMILSPGWASKGTHLKFSDRDAGKGHISGCRKTQHEASRGPLWDPRTSPGQNR